MADPMSPIQQLLDRFVMLQQFDLQKKQLGLQERQVEAGITDAEARRQTGALELITQIARNSDDLTQAQKAIEAFAPQIGWDVESTMDLVRAISPSAETTTVAAARRGRGTMDAGGQQTLDQGAAARMLAGDSLLGLLTGQFLGEGIQGLEGPEREQVQSAAVLRQLTGMDPGAFASSLDVAAMPGEDLRRANRVRFDLETGANANLSAAVSRRGQDLGYASSMAGNRLGWAELAQRGELGLLGLKLEGQKLLAATAGGSGGIGLDDVPELLNTSRALTEQLGQAQNTFTEQQVLSSLNAINSILGSLGFEGLPQTNGVAPNKVTGRGAPFARRSPFPTAPTPAQIQGVNNLTTPMPWSTNWGRP